MFAPAIVGVVRVGDVANTAAPLPVSSVRAAARLAEDGVARNVATPLPSPETPVDTGSPVQFVRVPEAGVPSAGVVNVGLEKVAPELEIVPLIVPPLIVAVLMVGLENVAPELDRVPLSVPPLIVGLVSVLFVKVWDEDRSAIVLPATVAPEARSLTAL
jgi:hypothetical protein